jgi:hypothetical protein
MADQQKQKPKQNRPKVKSDDFVAVARRLGCDENKERFEAKLRKIAKAKPPAR